MSDLPQAYGYDGSDEYSKREALELYKQGKKLLNGSERRRGEEMMKDAEAKLRECGYKGPLP